MYVILIGIGRYISHSSKNNFLREMFIAGISYLLLGVARYSIFGEIVSNTGATKFHPSLDSVVRGVRYIYASSNTLFSAPVLLLILFGLLISLRRKEAYPQIGGLIACVVFILLAGGDFMWGGRFLMHGIGCIYCIALAAAREVGNKILIAGIVAAQLMWGYAKEPYEQFIAHHDFFSAAVHADV